MLAFFPWLTIKDTLTIQDRFALIPYRRGQHPSGPGSANQHLLDMVLEPYVEQQGSSVDSATLLGFKGAELGSDLPHDKQQEAFVLADFMAFTGLASRRLFTHFGYCNRDSFRFIIQNFTDPGAGATVTSRRRDGGVANLIAGGVFKVSRPFHVSSYSKVDLDAGLLERLITLDEEDRESYWEAIVSYNLANSDNDQMTERVEGVLLIGAFERLLNVRNGREADLVEALARIWSGRGIPGPMQQDVGRSTLRAYQTCVSGERPVG